MKRPVPVVLSAILLGLLAAVQLIGTVSMFLMGFISLHKGLPGPPGPTPFSPSFLPILFFLTSVFTTALAVWCILTLIGLVRLRSWARYSILVIAGCMAGFGAISTVTSFAMPFLMPPATTQPAPDPHMMRVVFFVGGAIYGIITAIGVALLVYYNLAKTRALFLQNAPVSLDPPNTSTGRPRPTAVTVISWIYLVSAPFCLIYVFLPLPTFLLGFVVYGLAAHLIYLVLSVLMFTIGYGLLRLWNGARLSVFALFALCPLQVIVLLTPWGTRQFRTYMDAFNTHMYANQPVPQNPALSPGALLLFSFLGMAGYGVILWLLHRHRVAFTPAPPPPPLVPSPPELLAE